MSDLRWARTVCRGRVEYHMHTDGTRLFVRHVGEGVWIWSAINSSTGEYSDGWNCSERLAKERAEKAVKKAKR